MHAGINLASGGKKGTRMLSETVPRSEDSGTGGRRIHAAAKTIATGKMKKTTRNALSSNS